MSSSHLQVHKAALSNDWDSVSQIFEKDPELMTKPINYIGETPLMIAVGTNASHDFVRQLVSRVVDIGGAIDQLFVADSNGDNPLHRAAKIGNTIDAKVLVEQNPDMTQVTDRNGHTPLTLAAWHRNKDTLRYLLKVATESIPGAGEAGSSVYTGAAGGDLITLTIQAGFLDMALEIIGRHPDIIVEENWASKTALEILGSKPEFYRSGSSLGLWNHVIYSQKADHDTVWKILGSATSAAVEYGVPEVLNKCILTYPDIIWYTDKPGRHLPLEAITQRQEQVYNVLWQSAAHKIFQATMIDEEQNENALHKAAKLAPPHRLNVVTGAALQMQRELQWFKEVENYIEPSFKEARNKSGKTPKETFIEEHKDLLDDAEQWMKDVATSCTVVAALIITMAFAGAFTLPGGNEDDGKPLFLNKGAFMLFIVSDAVALFSSTASVLMFLGILTARFAADDFLYNLPKRMTIGLVSMFVSLAATMIAFSATLSLVLIDKVTWIVAPLVVITCIPVGLFGWLQFPLLIELVNSTYGPSIFRQQKDRWVF
uniref:ankyrin repeat-containing protein NPR4-like isoform X2 n=1 Tax=Erigeron canadensis TaxID=72917 RepID=UPI001CB8D944|nr:ankyrin repeat-containing protein NPR4-like isoform X2 [Erigeron canadensis]